MKPRDITIMTVINGWVAKVGCQTLVFTSLDTMLADLTAYLEDPKATEDRYQKESVNAEFFNFADAVAQEVSGLDGVERRLEEAQSRVYDNHL